MLVLYVLLLVATLGAFIKERWDENFLNKNSKLHRIIFYQAISYDYVIYHTVHS